MSSFTKEVVETLADKLLIGLTEEENKVIELWYSVQAMTWYLVASFKDATGLGESLGLDFKEIATMFLRKAENLLKKY